ncbi:MAG: alpha/beta fold hydrolase [Solirubrobacterales bacterium]
MVPTGTGTNSVDLEAGTIHYRESGSGPTIVFAHGLLVDGTLWRKVTPLLEDRFRCVVPDLPLGSHREPMKPDADLTPPGLARIVADFIAALDLEDVTLVGNDTGGAISQIVAANHPERLGRLVLTPCDAYENFLPPFFRPLQYAAKVPGLLTALVQPTRLRAMQRGPLAFGLLISPENIDTDVLDAWVRPYLRDGGIRRDTIKFLRSISNRYTIEAAEKLRGFDRPTLIAWAPEDRFFKLRYAERLAAEIPNARLVRIENSRTFVSEDQPERLAEEIASFVSEPVTTAAN